MKTRSGEPLAEHLKEQVEALEAMPDESIDYSDAPSLDDWSGAVRGRFANVPSSLEGSFPKLVKLPKQIVTILQAVKELEAAYPGRKFTPDGHLVGSIGEVVAKETLGVTLQPMSHPGHDAIDAEGREVQIKMTWGKSVAMYGVSQRLVVFKAVSSEQAEIVYDGPGQLPWEQAGKKQKNGQRVISLAKLRFLQLRDPHPYPLPEGEGAERNS